MDKLRSDRRDRGNCNGTEDVLLLIAASALVLAIAVTPLMRRLALQTGTVDKPAARKIHASPVPLLGGRPST